MKANNSFDFIFHGCGASTGSFSINCYCKSGPCRTCKESHENGINKRY